MAAGGRRGSDELPVYLARPGTAAVPRQKRGGLFCSVEGAFESKTLDFGALRVGQRRATPSAARPEPDPAAVPDPDPGEVRAAADKERLQNLSPDDDKVRAGRRTLVPVRGGSSSRRRGGRRRRCFSPSWRRQLEAKFVTQLLLRLGLLLSLVYQEEDLQFLPVLLKGRKEGFPVIFQRAVLLSANWDVSDFWKYNKKIYTPLPRMVKLSVRFADSFYYVALFML